MSSKTRKRKSTAHIYEDESAQGTTTTPRTTSSAVAKRKQNTLTQMKWIPSSRASNEEFDLEYDNTPLQNRRRTTRSKRPKLAQPETITQMDFLSPILADERNRLLKAEEPMDTPPIPQRRKRREKVQKEEPLVRAIQNRSLKRSSASTREKPTTTRNSAAVETPVAQNMRRVQHPSYSPVTPRRRSAHIRRGEVPSSQSPPDSPLSLQSTRSANNSSGTPLRERSLNIISSRRSVGKGFFFPRKLEVAESTESDQNDTQIRSTSIISQPDHLPSAFRVPANPQLSNISDTAQSTPTQPLATECSPKQGNIHIKTEIEDSDEDKDDDISDKNRSTPGTETQAVYTAIVSSPNHMQLGKTLTATDAIPQSTADGRNFESVGDRGSIASEYAVAAPLDELLIPNFENTNASKTSFRGLDLLGTPHDVKSRKDLEIPPATFAESAAKTIQAGLPQRYFPSLAPETESQFENAWRTISPPPEISSPPDLFPDMIPSSQPSLDAHINQPVSPLAVSPFKIPPLPAPQEPASPSQATTIDYTQSQPLHCLPLQIQRSTSIQNLDRLPDQELYPPSQATTTDITQAQPSLPCPSPYDETHSSQHLSSPPLPPSLPTLLSSPLYSRKGRETDVWMGYAGGWNGKRKTDSQLLPDSLMNDSVAGPPGWGTQESLEEETCE